MHEYVVRWMERRTTHPLEFPVESRMILVSTTVPARHDATRVRYSDEKVESS
jgi:hypothetical protein